MTGSQYLAGNPIASQWAGCQSRPSIFQQVLGHQLVANHESRQLAAFSPTAAKMLAVRSSKEVERKRKDILMKLENMSFDLKSLVSFDFASIS